MLAYDLYLRNKDSKANIVRIGRGKPIKKIYINQDIISVDSKNIEEYGSEISDSNRILQESLAMPLNTSDSSLLNLPGSGGLPSTNQPNPYIKIFGTLKKSKLKSEFTIELTIQSKLTDKENKLEATYDVLKDETSIKAGKDIPLRVDRQNYYFINKENGEERKVNVFEQYVNSGILINEGFFSKDLFTRIAHNFFQFVKDSNLKEKNLDISKNSSFELFLLPSQSKIEYDSKTEGKEKIEIKFIDSFGNPATGYASASTINAKFLSFDEKAFTLNCKKKHYFYQNLGIGKESLPHVFLPADQVFDIQGLIWLFMDLSNSYQKKFYETRSGILFQLCHNFRTLDSFEKTTAEKSVLKVICLKTQQQKQEILIDENLTMDRMRRLFSKFNSLEIPHLAFEKALIYREKGGEVVLRDDYLYGIRSYLSESWIPRQRLLASFKRILKSRIFDWIKESMERQKGDNASKFFIAADFCLKTLSRGHEDDKDMNNSEDFAYNVGIVTRLYIDFKNQINEKSNSLRDILTYSKYDREKLRFVSSRVCQGINLSKANEDEKAEITREISRYTSRQEIADHDAFNDYSYFFYKGYFLGAD